MPTRRRFLASTAGLGLTLPRAMGEQAIRNGPEHNGTAVACDLDLDLRIRNTVGTDQKGLCVWASLCMGARWHNCDELSNIFADMTHEPGGGWPARVDEKMRQYAPHIKYEQYVGESLDFVARHVRKGRLVCATYGYGEMYREPTISHMVCIAGMETKLTAVLDNNDPEHIWWMTTPEYGKRFRHPTGRGWAVALHLPPPPPPPHNLT